MLVSEMEKKAESISRITSAPYNALMGISSKGIQLPGMR